MLSSVVTSRICPLHIISYPQIPETFRTSRHRNPNQFSIFHTLAFHGLATSSDSTTSPLFTKQPGGIPLHPILEPTAPPIRQALWYFLRALPFPGGFPKMNRWLFSLLSLLLAASASLAADSLQIVVEHNV